WSRCPAPPTVSRSAIRCSRRPSSWICPDCPATRRNACWWSPIGPSTWSAPSGAPSSPALPSTSRSQMSDPDVRLTAWIHGRVQGVGFRWWTRSRALELGLTGYAANVADGRVLVVAQGPREAGEKLLQLLDGGAAPGRVDQVVADWSQPAEQFSGFVER